MGILDIFRMNSNVKLNDELSKAYGTKNVKAAYKEAGKELNSKFVEILDINDEILSLYNKKNNSDIQKEILGKYLKDSQEDISNKILKKEEIKEELSDIDGIDDKTKDEIAEDVVEKEGEEGPKTKEELKAQVYKITYQKMYKDYTFDVLKMKNAQFYASSIAVGEASAVKMIAMEKSLEKLEMAYHLSTGKNFSKEKDISKDRKEFTQKFRYDQKGIDNQVDSKVYILKEMYQKREARYREYIKALTDPDKTQSEKDLYKKDYESANLDLINNLPSLKEYATQLNTQEKFEKLAKDEGVEGKSAINKEFDANSFKDKNSDFEKVTESKTTEDFEKVVTKKQEEQEKSIEYASDYSKDQRKKGNYGVSKDINDAQTAARISEDSIDELPQSSDREDVKKDIKKEQEAYDTSFMSNLRAGVQTGMTEEQAENEINEELRKKSYEEEQKSKKQSEEIVRTRKKPDGSNW